MANDHAAPHPRTTRASVAALVLILAVAAVLRGIEAARTPLWFDEIYLVLAARRSLPDVIALAARDIHPPLLFVLTWAWRGLFGEATLALKAMPIAVGLATIALTARLGRRVASPQVGLLAAGLVALHVVHVDVSQGFEVYALLALFFTALANLTWDALDPARTSRATWPLLAVVGVLALYTHYLMLYVLGATVLAGLVLARPGRRLRWLVLAALLAIAFAPQAPTYLAQFRREGAGAYFRWATPAQLYELARRISFAEAFTLPLMAFLAATPLMRGAHRRAAVLLWTLVALPLVAKRLLPLVPERDFVAAIPLLCVLAAAGASTFRPRVLATALGVLLLVCDAYAWHAHGTFAEPHDLSRAADFIAARARPGDWIVQAETHGLLFFVQQRPRLGRSRLLVAANRDVPFFEGGLVVPDSLRLDPLGWQRVRTDGAWWGVHVDRAFVRRGIPSRAGVVTRAQIDSAARSGPWRFGKVTVWAGRPGVAPPR